MKKVFLILFLNLISLNQAVYTQQRFDGRVLGYAGYWLIKGDRLHLELYSQGNEIERFCKIVFYDDQRRQLSVISFNSDPIILLPKTISQFEKRIDNKDVRKTERLIIETCNGIVTELDKQRSSLNKTLDKSIGR